MSRQAHTILVTVVATLVVILVLQNTQHVTVRFIVWNVTMPLAVLLPVIFAGGFAAGWVWRRRR